MSGPSPAVRAAVIARDLSKCQWCGRHVATESGWYSLQHRRARGMGGTRRLETDQPANLLLVCGTGTTECHGWIESQPAQAIARGFRISSGAVPARIPYVDWTGREWILTDAAGKELAALAPLTLSPGPRKELGPPLPPAATAILDILQRSKP